MQTDQEGARGVVDVWITDGGKEDVLDRGSRRQGEGIFILTDLVAFDVFDRVG